MVGLLFPGQGSQYVGMGRDLAEGFASARATFEEADEALGASLSRIMWDGPEEELTATHNAQPAILVHSIAVHRLLEGALPPVMYAAGHSLGEFSAYVAAGTMSFSDAVRTVRRRGELMYAGGQQRPGTMAAVLGLPDEELVRVCREVSAASGGVVVPANFNSPGQTVISGDIPAVEQAMEAAKAAGAKRALKLNVSGAFHSPLMETAVDGLRRQLATVPLGHPRFPVVSNVTARPISTGAEAGTYLVEQLTSAVRWTDGMRAMRAAGVTRFIELGPGNVLAGLAKRIDKEVEVRSIGTAVDVEGYLAER